MGSNDGVLSLLAQPTIPLWIAALTIFVGVWRVVPQLMERANERYRDTSSAKANDWTRLREEIARLDVRVRVLEEQNESLRERANRAEAEVTRLTAIDLAQAEIRSDVAARVAAERVEDADRRRREGK